MLGRLQPRLREAGAISELIPVENQPWMVCVHTNLTWTQGSPQLPPPGLWFPKCGSSLLIPDQSPGKCQEPRTFLNDISGGHGVPSVSLGFFWDGFPDEKPFGKPGSSLDQRRTHNASMKLYLKDGKCQGRGKTNEEGQGQVQSCRGKSGIGSNGNKLGFPQFGTNFFVVFNTSV